MAVEVTDRIHRWVVIQPFRRGKAGESIRSGNLVLVSTCVVGGAGLSPEQMKFSAAVLTACALILAGCEEKKELTITETRAATTRDKPSKLFASSDERFRDAKPSPVQGTTPDGWLALPASQFRLLNYRFGESGMGEVWVSLSAGSVLDNTNRWLGQFGGKNLDDAGLAALPTATLAGASGKWVTAEGEYASGMGAPAKPGFALAGIVALVDGQILTLKMVGPKSEVQAAKPVLETFAKSLHMVD